jgi:hypothetical protein
MMIMTRSWLAAIAMFAVACAADQTTSSTEQVGRKLQGRKLQGRKLQGTNLQGTNLEGMTLLGLRFSDATLDGVPLTNLRVVKGELLAERDGVTLRGTALAGARLIGDASDGTQTASVDYQIDAVETETAANDPTGTGNTFLYTFEQLASGSWVSACDPDEDGREAAIPIGATWDATGARIESSTHFTFGCTSAVIGKCYRWGYRPWLTGYGGANFVNMHQTCTRLARADYCGNGESHTHDGTDINVWDRLPAPGPIQKHGLLPPLGYIFEAGWNTNGAVCLSRARWLLSAGLDLDLANLCPDRLVPPALLGGTLLGGAVCETVGQVLDQDPTALMYNESSLLNLELGILGL